MKKPRIKIVDLPLTRVEVESLVNEIACTENNRRSLVQAMDAEILSIRESFGPRIDACAAELKIKSARIQTWATENPAEFGNKKSIDFPAGKVGFRTGTPKLKTLSGWTFARVLEKLQSLAWGAAFVRVKTEVDKDGILAQVSQGSLQPAELREIGVKVEQDESFYIEPDLTPFETRITKEAA